MMPSYFGTWDNNVIRRPFPTRSAVVTHIRMGILNHLSQKILYVNYFFLLFTFKDTVYHKKAPRDTCLFCRYRYLATALDTRNMYIE